jgi:hypothetical protein
VFHTVRATRSRQRGDWRGATRRAFRMHSYQRGDRRQHRRHQAGRPDVGAEGKSQQCALIFDPTDVRAKMQAGDWLSRDLEPTSTRFKLALSGIREVLELVSDTYCEYKRLSETARFEVIRLDADNSERMGNCGTRAFEQRALKRSIYTHVRESCQQHEERNEKGGIPVFSSHPIGGFQRQSSDRSSKQGCFDFR